MRKEFEMQITDYVKWHNENCSDCVLNTDCDNVNRNISVYEEEYVISETVSAKSPGIVGVCNDILKKRNILIAPLLLSFQ